MSLKKYTKEFRYNLILAYPVIIGLLGHTLVQLVDNIMVGQLGTAELAAVSLGNSFFFVAMALGIGFSTLNKWIKLLNMVFSMVFELVGSCNQLKSKENNLLLTIEWE